MVRAVGPGDGRRLVRDRVDALYYHTDHLGTPRELTNTDGHIVWEARYKAWGGTQRIEYPPVLHTFADGNTVRQYWIEPLRHERPVQNLRFQGQYYDEETGLHYNRFRYYDPDIGRFVSQDPIGLAGGINAYQYAPNPVAWVDPFGLTGERPPNLSPSGAGRRGAFREAKRNSGIPVCACPTRVKPNQDRRGKPTEGRQYEFDQRRSDGSVETKVIRDDAGGHDFGPGNPQNRGPHINDPAGGHYDY
ncbi:RHS repeat-associated core domain-containing protein [Thauera butanivorans]|uniref:RHS repeat-associated core domain-containing protein n=1 Tax=Thauera butanivorans TaxID=86174 RepID=UPI0009FF63DF|nr:RHS repeat-associated core domain-containing protein [Thauera butanivorans]